jgi:hypothetical protein
VTLISFGDPRVGNRGFSDYFRSFMHTATADTTAPATADTAATATATAWIGAWRAVNLKDIVPHLPLKPGMDFYHVPQEVWREVP